MGFDSWCSKHTKKGLESQGGGSDLVYRNPKRLKLGTQKAVRKCPRKGDVKGTKLSPQSQQEKKIPLRLLHPLIFNFPVLHLMPFFKNIFFSLCSEPLPLEQGGIQVAALRKALPAQEAFQGLFFLFETIQFIGRTLWVWFSISPLTPLNCPAPHELSGGMEVWLLVLAGTSSVRQVLPREFSSHSCWCVSLEQIWLTRPALAGLCGAKRSGKQ